MTSQGLSAEPHLPTRMMTMRQDNDTYGAFLAGEVLLLGLLGASLALFVAYPSLRTSWDLPAARLVLDTAVSLAAVLVSVLAGVRFSVEGRRLDLLICSGFGVLAATNVAFAIAPVLGGQPVHRVEGWARLAGMVPTLYLAAFVWNNRLVVEPSVTRLILIGVILIVLMNARPQGLLGTARVEIV